MRIKKLTAKNFRLFTDLEINFPDENFICLIGNNGSGKSAVLDLLNLNVRYFLNYLILKNRSKGSTTINYKFNTDDIRQNNNKLYSEMLFEFESQVDTFIKSDFTSISRNQIHYSSLCDDNYMDELLKKITNGDTISIPIFLYFDVKRLQNRNDKVLSFDNFDKGDLISPYFTILLEHGYISLKEFENWFINETNRENLKAKKNKDYESPSLIPLRIALLKFLTHLEKQNFLFLSVTIDELDEVLAWEYGESYVVLEKENNEGENFELRLSQLSSGERMIIFLVAEIARRLTISNKNNKAEALNGKGVVLIDELDLHLHPNWQRNIVGALKTTFPNVQFITTTHSPQVLSSLKASEIIEIDGDKVHSPNVNPYGRDSNNILSTVMNDGARSKEREAFINSIFMNFAEDKNDEAIKQFEQLKPMLSNDDPIIGRIESIIKRKEILNS